MASKQLSQPESFSILLDQGFPKPTAFAISELDRSVNVVHFSDQFPDLAARSTPDWYVYCVTAEAGFNALVVRDRSQLDQLAEMYVLSRLRALSIVTWRKGVDDPIREWGQLLAYLPQIRQRSLEAGGRAIQLPVPSLDNRSLYKPGDTIGIEASQRGVSNGEILREARAEITDWLSMSGESTSRFDQILDLATRS